MCRPFVLLPVPVHKAVSLQRTSIQRSSGSSKVNDRFVTVEKFERAGHLAAELNPREPG
jgi:hypothetical protein